MSESVSVRCPACRRAHTYSAPSYPCACGAPVTAPLDRRGTPAPVTHRSWDEEWLAVRCAVCGRTGQWPRPELGCPCGTTLRIPVAGRGGSGRPVRERDARDAVLAAARHLHRLGHRDLHRAEHRPTSGVALTAPGLLAHVDPSGRTASLRDVECLWLTAMTRSLGCVHFARGGYAADARVRADRLGVPLFVLDPAGGVRPVNPAADAFGTPGT
ncbi:hypothetical protein [Streptomyces sp. NPDC057877]|uniref:hypothetical protein n=1 Tax=Streptomyces sp. NPDC057877 TaxID=3346269 RepID=UPI0036AF3B31